MIPISLQSRLLTVAGLVRPEAYFADIGTDHGYLPIYLVQTGQISRAIAADINEKPLLQAKNAIRKYQLEAKIEAVLSDGLQRIDPAVTDIAVAGMGGELIAAILSKAEWIRNPEKRLLLQPMTQDKYLRSYLSQNGFQILNETIAAEKQHLYTILEAVYTGKAAMLSKAELYAGKSLYKQDFLSQKYLRKKQDTLLKIAAGLKKADGQDRADDYIALAAELGKHLLKKEKTI